MPAQQPYQAVCIPSLEPIVRRGQTDPKDFRHQGKRVSFRQGQDTQRTMAKVCIRVVFCKFLEGHAFGFG
jgi:hypothetical protein